MELLRDFGYGLIALGFAIIFPNLDSVLGNFYEFSPTELVPIVFGLMLVSIYFFVRPASRGV